MTQVVGVLGEKRKAISGVASAAVRTAWKSPEEQASPVIRYVGYEGR
jgi:hypothetical protein